MNINYRNAIQSLRNIANYGGTSEEVDEAADVLEELVNKFEKTATPRLKPCICGHNRRSRSYEWVGTDYQVTLICNRCKKEVVGINERDASIKWNEVMMSEKEERK